MNSAAENNDVLNPPTPASIYEEQRGKLLPLLDRGAGLLENQKVTLPSWQEAARQLRNTRRKLLEDRFSIVLLADMKAGKSTIFNAVACGGRELSPVGTTIRTSGCEVRAQNLADENEAELAEIVWRTSEELIRGFDDLLLPRLRELAPGRFDPTQDASGQQVPPDVAKQLDLEKAEDRDLVRRAAEGERDLWLEDKAKYDPENMDIFRYALLVAEFYGHAELQKLRQRQQFELEEVGQHIRYPEDWETRWKEGDPAKFRWNEIVFAFVRSAQFFLHAPQLAKIGSALVDCPGLFASRSDTEVTFAALQGADAILYLFPGDKQIALSQLQVLRDLRPLGMDHKLFFAWNMRTSEKKAQQLFNLAQATLQNEGFKTPAGGCFLVHAGLALLSEQAEKLLQDKLDKETVEAIAQREEVGVTQVPKKVWSGIAKFRSNLQDEDEPLPVPPTAGGVEQARTESCVGEFVARCQDFVVRNKASFALLENGADFISQKLQTVESALGQREGQALQKVEEHREDSRKAGEELLNFEGRSEVLLNEFQTPETASADQQLAAEFTGRLTDEFRLRMAHAMAERIFQEVIGLDLLWKGLFRRKEVDNRVRAITREVMSRAIDGEFRAWFEEVESGRSAVYRREIARRVERVQRGLQAEWEKVAALNIAILKQIPLPSLSSDIREAVRQAPNVFEASQVPDPALTHLQRSGALVLVAIGTAVGAAIAIHLAAATTWLTTLLYGPTLAGPVGWALAGVTTAILAGVWVLGGKNAARAKVEKKIDEELGKQWSTIRQEIEKSVIGLGFGIRSWYREAFRKEVVGKPRRIFEERKADADRLFSQSQADRDRVAAAAKELREKAIVPLRADLETFSTECRAKLRAAGFPG